MSDTKSVTLTRVFNAPIDLVYQAWADAQQVSKWMKCEPGVTVSYDGWEARVGAEFSSVMAKPGEWEVKSTGRIIEADPPRVFAYAQDPNPQMNMPEMSVRAEFEEVDGGTKLTLTHSGLPNDEMCGIVEGGWSGGMQQLEELLAARTA